MEYINIYIYIIFICRRPWSWAIGYHGHKSCAWPFLRWSWAAGWRGTWGQGFKRVGNRRQKGQWTVKMVQVMNWLNHQIVVNKLQGLSQFWPGILATHLLLSGSYASCRRKLVQGESSRVPHPGGAQWQWCAAGRAAWEFNAIKLLPATDSTVTMQDDGGFLSN